MSAASKRHMGRVASLPCVACRLILGRRVPSEQVHHIESVRDEASDYLTVPLCHEHHQGSGGIHQLSRRGFARTYGFDELRLLAETISLLGE